MYGAEEYLPQNLVTHGYGTPGVVSQGQPHPAAYGSYSQNLVGNQQIIFLILEVSVALRLVG